MYSRRGSVHASRVPLEELATQVPKNIANRSDSDKSRCDRVLTGCAYVCREKKLKRNCDHSGDNENHNGDITAEVYEGGPKLLFQFFNRTTSNPQVGQNESIRGLKEKDGIMNFARPHDLWYALFELPSTPGMDIVD